jgi:hypothetical protein
MFVYLEPRKLTPKGGEVVTFDLGYEEVKRKKG